MGDQDSNEHQGDDNLNHGLQGIKNLNTPGGASKLQIAKGQCFIDIIVKHYSHSR